jgi:hypothetical protein
MLSSGLTPEASAAGFSSAGAYKSFVLTYTDWAALADPSPSSAKTIILFYMK